VTRAAHRLALLLAAAVSVAALVAPRPASASPASSYSKAPWGARGLFVLLEDLGYRAGRIFRASDLTNQHDVLVVLGPLPTPPSEAGEDPLARWVRKGNLLLLAPGESMLDRECPNVEPAGTLLRRKERDESSKVKAGDLTLQTPFCVLLAARGDKVLAGTIEAALALSRRLGRGQVLALAHQGQVINDQLADDDMAVLLRRWLKEHAPKQARVVFLEERAGWSLLRLLQRTHLLPFALHGLLLLLLLYWSLAPRTDGDPPPPETYRRREFSQHARALGHLYQRQKAAAHALREQYQRFLGRFIQRKGEQAASSSGAQAQVAGRVTGRYALAGSGSTAEREATAAFIATRVGRPTDEVLALLQQVEDAAAGVGLADARIQQRYFRLSQQLAALLSRSRARDQGGKRGSIQR